MQFSFLRVRNENKYCICNCQLLIPEHEKRKHDILIQSITMTAQWPKRGIQAFFHLFHLKSSCFQMPLLLPVANSQPLPCAWHIYSKLHFKRFSSRIPVHLKIGVVNLSFSSSPAMSGTDIAAYSFQQKAGKE